MLLFIVRIFYLIVVLAFTSSFAFRPEVYSLGNTTYVTMYMIIPIAMAFLLVAIDTFWKRKRLQSLSGLFFGLLAGLAIAYVLSQTVTLVNRAFIEPAGSSKHSVASETSKNFTVNLLVTSQPAAGSSIAVTNAPVVAPAEVDIDRGPITNLIIAILSASAVYMCISFILQTKDDFRFVIPYVEFAKETRGSRPVLLDTSVIIDGRIADIAETKIVDTEVIVPRFILSELQAIADSEDKLKRNRGRRGLDILNRLQNNEKIGVKVLDAHVPTVDDATDVDAKLVALTKHLNGRVMTNDYNLNKIAQLRGVDVININDLANALKPIVLPGEGLMVKILKPGEEMGQGVGYLEDGTMVVAEGAREAIGKEISITVTSVLQTSAGRMIFGRLEADKNSIRRDRRV